MSQEKRQITVQEIENLLEQGMQRPEIAEHLGIPLSVLQKTVFQHPKLKGRKAKKVYDIIVVDEEEVNNLADATNETSQENEEQVVTDFEQVTEDSVNSEEIQGNENLAETVSAEEDPKGW